MKLKKAQKILDGVKQTYTEIADEFDTSRTYLWKSFYHFLKYVKDGSHILDAGCGNGRLSVLFEGKGVNYIGMDNNPELLSIAKNRYPNKTFVLGDMLKIPFEENSFDIIFCIAAYHHIPTIALRKRGLEEFSRALKKNGCFILTVWDCFYGKYRRHFYKNFLKKIFTFSFHEWRDVMIPWGQGPKRYYHFFSPDELKKEIESGGFLVKERYAIRTPQERNLVVIAQKS